MKAGTLSLVIAVSLFFTSSITAQEQTRVEKDLLGQKEIPVSAYYGVQTARALENFQISDITINHYPGFVEAWAIVKLAAARANTDVGAMKPEKSSCHRKGLSGGARRQVSRPVCCRLVPGRSRHVDQHERQRGAGQHRARTDGPQERRVPVRRSARRSEHVAVDQRLLSDCDQGRHSPAQRQARWPSWKNS